jgi:hypothetical protein
LLYRKSVHLLPIIFREGHDDADADAAATWLQMLVLAANRAQADQAGFEPLTAQKEGDA